MTDHPPLKQPKTFEEQLTILKNRNLSVHDDEEAINVLSRISYYRFTGYLIEYKLNENEYMLGTDFKNIYDTYQFDTRLRHLLLSILEPIEISIRTKVAYFLGHRFGSIGYRNVDNFMKATWHANHLETVDKEIRRSKEMFVEHYQKKYGGQFPIWVAAEVMSFGTVSMFYSNMRRSDRNDVSKGFFNVEEVFFTSWMKTLVRLRNSCAHYARIYGKNLSAPPKILSEDKDVCHAADLPFAALLICRRLYSPRKQWLDFVTSLSSLVDEYSRVISVDSLGFPEDWEDVLRAVPDKLR